MRKKKHSDSHENSERWLLTYADMITLLMAFFIMMYSMSVLNVSKFRDAAISIRSGFGGIVKGQGKSILGAGSAYTAKPTPVKIGDTTNAAWGLVKPLVTYIQKNVNTKNNVQVITDQRGIIVSMSSDKLLFKPGSADIRSEAYPLLDQIGQTLDRTANIIRVEGHTCDLPPRRGGQYPTNWELSTARATNVLRFFVEIKGLDARAFCAAGYAGTHPLVPNTSEENRRRNRRVDIVIVKGEEFPMGQPVREPAQAWGEIRRRSD